MMVKDTSRSPNRHNGIPCQLGSLHASIDVVADMIVHNRSRGAVLCRTDDPSGLYDQLLDFAGSLGTTLPQNEQGDLLDEVTFRSGAHVRGAKTRRDLPFHTDLGPTCPDIFFLACVSNSANGGNTLLVDLGRQHELAASWLSAETLATLSNPIPFDLSDDAAGDIERVCEWPILGQDASGHSQTHYNRARIHRGCRSMGRTLSQDERHALDELDAALAQPSRQAVVSLLPGDVLCVDNRRCVHAREAFTDRDTGPRLLLRVWLSTLASPQEVT